MAIERALKDVQALVSLNRYRYRYCPHALDPVTGYTSAGTVTVRMRWTRMGARNAMAGVISAIIIHLSFICAVLAPNH